MSTRRVVYALAGGVLGLGAPVGLLFIRLRRGGLSVRSALQDIRADCETYIYTATSTTVAFSLFGGVLGHYADRLAQLATTDPLTGLFNARAFDERLREETRRAVRYQEPLSLLIVDLDGLKRVNDQYGHEAGNSALQSVAAAIRSGLREIDLGTRIGGDSLPCWRRARTRSPPSFWPKGCEPLWPWASTVVRTEARRSRSKLPCCRHRRMHDWRRPH